MRRGNKLTTRVSVQGQTPRFRWDRFRSAARKSGCANVYAACLQRTRAWVVKVRVARGREGGASRVRRTGGRGSSGIYRQFENRRRLPAVPLTPWQKFVGTVADFSATQKERTCVFAEGRSADPSSLWEVSCDPEARLEREPCWMRVGWSIIHLNSTEKRSRFFAKSIL